MTPTERDAIVAEALAEVSARAAELFEAGASIASVTVDMQTAAELIAAERVDAAMRHWQAPSALDALVEHANSAPEAQEARRAYDAATRARERDAIYLRLLGFANRGALWRFVERSRVRILAAWRVVRQGVAVRGRERRHRPRVTLPPPLDRPEPPTARAA